MSTLATILTGAPLSAAAALGGVALGQWRTGRREAVQWERERQRQQEAWERERQRQQEAWDREDRARTFEQRRQAYADFYAQLRVSSGAIMMLRADMQPSAEAWQRDLQEAFAVLSFYATRVVERAAQAAYSSLMEEDEDLQPAVMPGPMGEYDVVDDDEVMRRDAVAAEYARELLRVMRLDLGVPVE